MDELRDYRFYAEDMIHLSKTAEEYIFERMVDTYCDSTTRENMAKVEKFLKMANHRIQDESSPATQELKKKLAAQALELEKQIPGLSLRWRLHFRPKKTELLVSVYLHLLQSFLIIL